MLAPIYKSLFEGPYYEDEYFGAYLREAAKSCDSLYLPIVGHRAFQTCAFKCTEDTGLGILYTSWLLVGNKGI